MQRLLHNSSSSSPVSAPCSLTESRLTNWFAKFGDPFSTFPVRTHHDIGSHYRTHDFGVQWTGNRGCHSSSDRHCQKCCVQSLSVGQSKTDIGGTTGCIDLQFLTKSPNYIENLSTGHTDGTNRHHERVDYYITASNSIVLPPFPQFSLPPRSVHSDLLISQFHRWKSQQPQRRIS